MRYHRTQKGPWWPLLLAFSGVFAAVGSSSTGSPVFNGIMFAAAAFMLALAPCFVFLTVRDGGEQLVVEFGPVPVFRRRINYSDIVDVTVAKSKPIDGWGVHFIPGRGWTYNIYGFGCVEIRTRSGSLRVGSPEPETLAAFLLTRISPVSPSSRPSHGA